MPILNENDVVGAVARYLQPHCINRPMARKTYERGVDIEATLRSGEQLQIEAKGGTSATPGTARYGLPFSRNQVRSHVARALLTTLEAISKGAGRRVIGGMAFPDDEIHWGFVCAIAPIIRKLKLRVFFVDRRRSVREYRGVESKQRS